MKGADQCPRCASRRWTAVHAEGSKFYAPDARVCANCLTAWEPIDVTLIWDKTDKLASFSEPCSNCAFRPGSPEQADKDGWKKLIDSLANGAGFYCHKGVPIEPDSEHGFAYPKNGADRSKLRLCRGYLKTLGKRWGVARGQTPPDHSETP